MGTPLFALAALLISTAARAEVICNGCAAKFPGTYLGAYWPGDRGTFHGANASPVAPIDHLFVIDANDNGTLNLSGERTRCASRFITTTGSLCDASGCTQVVLGPRIGSALRRLRNPVVPGRYVLRVIGPAGASYTGSVAVRR